MHSIKLYTIRHPQPQGVEGLCYGHSDVPTLPSSLDTALVRLPHELPPGLPIYSSPLARCRLLAERLQPLIKSPNINWEARLMEMNFGAWEMRAWNTIGAEALQEWANDVLDFRPPGGETVREVYRRAQFFLHSLMSARIDAAVVITHSGVLRCLASLNQSPPNNDNLALSFPFAQINLMQFPLSMFPLNSSTE